MDKFRGVRRYSSSDNCRDRMTLESLRRHALKIGIQKYADNITVMCVRRTRGAVIEETVSGGIIGNIIDGYRNVMLRLKVRSMQVTNRVCFKYQ